MIKREPESVDSLETVCIIGSVTNQEGSMKTFKEYLSEAAPLNKSQYADIKSRFGREIEKAFLPAVNLYLDYAREGKIARDNNGFDDLYWDQPHSSADLKKIAKIIAKTKDKSHPIYLAFQAALDSVKDRAAEIEALKDTVVSATVQRATVKAAVAVVAKKRVEDNGSLIRELNKHREEYKAKGGKLAGERYDWLAKQLEAAGFDLDVIAPEPKTNVGREEYQRAKHKRALYYAATGGTGKPSTAIRAKQVATAILEAEASYDAWVAKMLEKIGKQVETASATGNPWTGSRLEVTTVDGEKQVWNTQMILNYSKYDKIFNQFPSRRVV